MGFVESRGLKDRPLEFEILVKPEAKAVTLGRNMREIERKGCYLPC